MENKRSLIQKSSIEREANHIYYNISVYNNTNTDQPAVFSETRNEVILDKPSDYYLSVVRALIPTSQVPIFYYPGSWYSSGGLKYPTNSPNTTDGFQFKIIMKYGNNYGVGVVNYQNSFPDFTFTAAEDDSYYAVYSYQDFTPMINKAILTAFNQLLPNLPTAGTCFGYEIVSGGSNYSGATNITISAPAAGVTATATPIITNGVITGVTFTNNGSGYTDAKSPIATIVDGTGSGAIIRIIAAPTWVPPFLDFDESTGTLSFVAQTAYNTSNNPPVPVPAPDEKDSIQSSINPTLVRMFMTYDLFSFFYSSTISTFWSRVVADQTYQNCYEITFKNLYDNAFDLTPYADLAYLPGGWNPNFATATPAVFSTKAYQMKQEFTSLSDWTDISTILLQTGSVPLRNEFAPAIKPSSSDLKQIGGGFIPIMTDFQVGTSTGTDIRTQIVYTPQSEYRLIDLISDSPMKTFDLSVFWTTITGRLHQLRIAPFQSLNVKFMFRKKSFNAIPMTNELIYGK